jgi:hypothetical protein
MKIVEAWSEAEVSNGAPAADEFAKKRKERGTVQESIERTRSNWQK